MADSSPTPENAAPKAGAVAPPPLELVASVTAVLEGGEAKATWKVDGKPGDDGEYEYIAIARIPDLDVASNPAGQTPLKVLLMPDRNVIATQVNAIGGGQVSGTHVQLVDPDTNLPAGEPAETDEEGRVVLIAPENKPYRIRIIEDDDGIAPPGEESEDTASDTEVNDGGPVLYARLFGPGGVSVGAGVEVRVSGPAGFRPTTLRTDAEGDILLDGVPKGIYILSANGKQAKVPTLSPADIGRSSDPSRVLLK